MVNCTEENSLMDRDCAETDANFTFSFFQNEDGSYFDMDFNGKFSKVGMADFNYSPPPVGKPLRFMGKLKPVKVASLPLLTTEYNTKQSSDYQFSSIRTSTSAKYIVQKYVRLVKLRIFSQRHNDQQSKMQKGCGWPCIAGPCIADESERQAHVKFRHINVDSCPPSMKSSSSFSSDNVQSAIDYCKQSNGVIDTHREMGMSSIAVKRLS